MKLKLSGAWNKRRSLDESRTVKTGFRRGAVLFCTYKREWPLHKKSWTDAIQKSVKKTYKMENSQLYGHYGTIQKKNGKNFNERHPALWTLVWFLNVYDNYTEDLLT